MGIFYNNNYINESINDINIMEETYKLLYESQLEYNKIFIECGITEGYLLEAEGSFKERIKALIKRFIEWLKHIKDNIKKFFKKSKAKIYIQELEYEKAIKEWKSMQKDTDYKYEMEEFEAEYITPNNLYDCMESLSSISYSLNPYKFTDSESVDSEIEKAFDKLYKDFDKIKSKGMKDFNTDSELISSIKEFVTKREKINITKSKVNDIIHYDNDTLFNNYFDNIFNRISTSLDKYTKAINEIQTNYKELIDKYGTDICMKNINKYLDAIKRMSMLYTSCFGIYSEARSLIIANHAAILNKAINNLDEESKKVINNNIFLGNNKFRYETFEPEKFEFEKF